MAHPAQAASPRAVRCTSGICAQHEQRLSSHLCQDADHEFALDRTGIQDLCVLLQVASTRPWNRSTPPVVDLRSAELAQD
eukprot:8069362-Heterocapsa_arctica.AAC.1